jgi:glucokinase
MAQLFTGIDIGGSNVKFGLVDTAGNILEKKKIPTQDLRIHGHQMVDILTASIGEWIKEHPKVKHVGIGVPGTISRNGRTLVELANIPELNGCKLIERLERRFKKVQFHMENDANAAALGEFHFSKEKLPESFMLITLGTGVGSAAIINRKIFKGGGGNAMELGHIVSGNGLSVEQNIGKFALTSLVNQVAASNPDKLQSLAPALNNADADVIAAAATQNNPLALLVMERFGYILGQALVSAVYILDIKTILIGGGVSKAFPLMEQGIRQALKQYLTPYYYNPLSLKLATLGNNAGICGAAALCFKSAH